MAADNHLLILGCGYTGRAVARRMRDAGFAVTGVTRSVERAGAIETGGVRALVADPADADGRAALTDAMRSATHLLASAPPGEDGDPFFSGFRNMPPAGPRLDWIGYLSTTGVYGDRKGGWAFEWEPATPGNARSHRRALAETQWAEEYDAAIFRLPGIYGPGRSALDRVRAGDARLIDKPGQVFSRVHVDDIATGVAASIRRPDARGPFNLADDRPCAQAELVVGACAMLGIDPPPVEPWDPSTLSPMMASFYTENRRVSNARTKARLGWRPTYPTWREGLEAILQADR